jgi:hypothetical protein
MGTVQDFADEAVASNASYYGTGASVRLDSVGTGSATGSWWVMSYVTISNLDIVNAEPGTYRTVSATYDGTTPYVSVTGCSGPSYGNYTFDGPAEQTEITITENEDGSRTLDFHAVFAAYDGTTQAVDGTINYRQGDVVPPPTYAATPIVATDLSQEGDMGNVTGYAGTATVSGEYYGASSYFRLDSVGEGWWVMSAINVANLDLRDAPAGTYRTVSGVYSETEPSVSTTGCSGPSYGNYTFDSGAQETEITITDNEDGSRNLEVVAMFSYGSGTQVARSRLRYTIGDATTTTR